MELVAGQLVQSRQGRDTARWYAVAGFTGQGSALRVLCVNGIQWTLARPKAKNPLHLQPASAVLKGEDMKTDLVLKRALKTFEQGLGQKCSNKNEQGG